MLQSVIAVKELNTSCKTLLYWIREKDTGNKLAVKQVSTWIDIVTTHTARAKVELLKLNLEQFVKHTSELLELNIDTSYIFQVSTASHKPDFTTYPKLKQQLELYKTSTSNELRQAGKFTSAIVNARTEVHNSKLVAQHLVNRAKGIDTIPENITSSETFNRPIGHYYTKQLLGVAKRIQPEIDKENELRLQGLIKRPYNQFNKGKVRQADKFLKQVVKESVTS